MPTLESMAAAEVLNRGPKSRAFYRIQATRKLTGGGNIIRRKAATGRRDSVIDDTAFATTVEDDVTRLYFEPGHYTIFENVGSFQLTVVRQVAVNSALCRLRWRIYSELDMGRVHPWVWLGRVGLGHKILRLGWIGLGRVQCQKI